MNNTHFLLLIYPLNLKKKEDEEFLEVNLKTFSFLGSERIFSPLSLAFLSVKIKRNFYEKQEKFPPSPLHLLFPFRLSQENSFVKLNSCYFATHILPLLFSIILLAKFELCPIRKLLLSNLVCMPSTPPHFLKLLSTKSLFPHANIYGL